MSIIESDKIDIEIQEQTDPDAGCKYLILVSYEGPNQSKEIAKVLMTNNKPHLRQTVDEGNVVGIDSLIDIIINSFCNKIKM